MLGRPGDLCMERAAAFSRAMQPPAVMQQRGAGKYVTRLRVLFAPASLSQEMEDKVVS